MSKLTIGREGYTGSLKLDMSDNMYIFMSSLTPQQSQKVASLASEKT